VLALDVVAPMDLPHFDNSAVDGYAVRSADVAGDGETALAVAGRLTAGSKVAARVAAGQAIRIFTGAPMPQDADTVFMQEDVRVDGDTVFVPSGLARGANRRLAGEDVKKGAVALPAGRVLDVQHVAIVEPGGARNSAAVFDANRYLLRGLLERQGAVVTDLGILADDQQSLSHALCEAARNHDLVLTSGGVSTGEADHVRSAVEAIGKLVFWRVAIKPGRPVAMGVIPGARPGASAAFAGLPGNPVAVFVTFVRVVKPLLRRLAGALAEPLTPLPVLAAFPYRKKQGRREYVRVSLRRRADGELEAIKHPQDGAGIITSLTQTDGLIELPDDVTAIAPGDRVGFLSYAALAG
jgi:molybdopterin molybdotransferase